MVKQISAAKDHQYTVQLPEQMDQDMVKLANRIGENHYGLLCRAMSLYISVKNRHLDSFGDGDKAMGLYLDMADGNQVKFIVK